MQAPYFAKFFSRPRPDLGVDALCFEQVNLALEKTRERLREPASVRPLVQMEAQLSYLRKCMGGRRPDPSRLERMNLAAAAEQFRDDPSYFRALVIAQSAARRLSRRIDHLRPHHA